MNKNPDIMPSSYTETQLVPCRPTPTRRDIEDGKLLLNVFLLLHFFIFYLFYILFLFYFVLLQSNLMHILLFIAAPVFHLYDVRLSRAWNRTRRGKN